MIRFLILAAAAWLVFRLAKNALAYRPNTPDGQEEQSDNQPEKLTPCPVCGTYYDGKNPQGCGCDKAR